MISTSISSIHARFHEKMRGSTVEKCKHENLSVNLEYDSSSIQRGMVSKVAVGRFHNGFALLVEKAYASVYFSVRLCGDRNGDLSVTDPSIH
jgi:hypothetical protein